MSKPENKSLRMSDSSFVATLETKQEKSANMSKDEENKNFEPMHNQSNENNIAKENMIEMEELSEKLAKLLESDKTIPSESLDLSPTPLTSLKSPEKKSVISSSPMSEEKSITSKSKGKDKPRKQSTFREIKATAVKLTKKKEIKSESNKKEINTVEQIKSTESEQSIKNKTQREASQKDDNSSSSPKVALRKPSKKYLTKAKLVEKNASVSMPTSPIAEVSKQNKTPIKPCKNKQNLKLVMPHESALNEMGSIITYKSNTYLSHTAESRTPLLSASIYDKFQQRNAFTPKQLPSACSTTSTNTTNTLITKFAGNNTESDINESTPATSPSLCSSDEDEDNNLLIAPSDSTSQNDNVFEGETVSQKIINHVNRKYKQQPKPFGKLSRQAKTSASSSASSGSSLSTAMPPITYEGLNKSHFVNDAGTFFVSI